MVLFADIGKKLEDKFSVPFTHSNPWTLEYHAGPKDKGFKHEAKLNREGDVIGSTTAKHKFEGIDSEIKLHSTGTGSFSFSGKPIPDFPAKAGIIFKQPAPGKGQNNSLEVNAGLNAKDLHTHAQYFPLTNSYVVSTVWTAPSSPQIGLGAEVSGPVAAVIPSYSFAGWAKYDKAGDQYSLTLKTAACDGEKLGKVVALAGARISQMNTFIGAKASYAFGSRAYRADLLAETSLNDKANTTIGGKIDEKAKVCAYLSRDISPGVSATVGAKVPSSGKEATGDSVAWGVKFIVKEPGKA